MDKRESNISGQPCSQPWVSTSLSPSPKGPKEGEVPTISLPASPDLVATLRSPSDAQGPIPLTLPLSHCGQSRTHSPLLSHGQTGFRKQGSSLTSSSSSRPRLLGLPQRTFLSMASHRGLGCSPHSAAHSLPRHSGQSLLWALGPFLLTKAGNQPS